MNGKEMPLNVAIRYERRITKLTIPLTRCPRRISAFIEKRKPNWSGRVVCRENGDIDTWYRHF